MSDGREAKDVGRSTVEAGQRAIWADDDDRYVDRVENPNDIVGQRIRAAVWAATHRRAGHDPGPANVHR